MAREGQHGKRVAQFRCLLFDLDGTLVDSRDDLVTSVNLTLNDIGRVSLPGDLVASFVGEGVAKLMERTLAASLGRAPSIEEVEYAVEIFGNYYQLHMLDSTLPYEGVVETLSHFRHLPMCVVTNKPLRFTRAILDGLGLSHLFLVVFGGDSLPERKPKPQPLLEAACLCRTPPGSCLMIGDSRVDVLAGRAAGMKTCGFTAGFRGRRELEGAGADFLITRFDELRDVIESA
ncbi:MAG: HAD-IA family hydrolase [Acidobacteriota bacterium]|nr:HAD-IA family hydrolase [Acidobacteriota bacterium]